MNNYEAKMVRLESGTVNLGTFPTVIEMCEGLGWVTYNDEDIVLYPGQ